MNIEQGDIFWAEQMEAYGSEPNFRRPYVIVQNNMFNYTRINTVVVCAITSNLKRAKSPGNVLLQQGEGNLPYASVVNITQIATMDRARFVEKIGTLSAHRIQQIIAGIHLLIEPRDY
jgi:mRNA interferase MazF